MKLNPQQAPLYVSISRQCSNSHNGVFLFFYTAKVIQECGMKLGLRVQGLKHSIFNRYQAWCVKENMDVGLVCDVTHCCT